MPPVAWDTSWHMSMDAPALELNELEVQGVTNIIRDVGHAYSHFIVKAPKRVVELWKITPQDASFLEEEYISIDALLALITSDWSEQLRLLREYAPADDEYLCEASIPNQAVFQHSITQSGALVIRCLFTGKAVNANQFIFARPSLAAYIFRAPEPYFVIASSESFVLKYVYFPCRDLMVLLKPDSGCWQEDIALLQATITLYTKPSIQNHSLRQTHKSVVLFTSFSGNIAHCLWNDLSGLEALVRTGTIKSVGRIIVGRNEYYGPINDLFPELNDIPISRVADIGQQGLIKHMFDPNILGTRVCRDVVTETLASRIRKYAVRSVTTSVLDTIKLAKLKRPLIWVTLRTGSRSWLEQDCGIRKVVLLLRENYPNIGVILDGYASAQPDFDTSVIGGVLADQLTRDGIPVYNTIGATLLESICWADAADFYLSPYGAGMAIIHLLANKPGVVHTNTTTLCRPGDLNVYNKGRENGITPVYIPSKYIKEIKNSGVRASDMDKRPHLDNYSCEPGPIAELLLEVALTCRGIPRRSEGL